MTQRFYCILYFLSFFCLHTASAQNAFYDSKRIVDYIQEDSIGKIIPILLNYRKEGESFPWARLQKKYPDHIQRIKDTSDAYYKRVLIDKLQDSSLINNKINTAIHINPRDKNLLEFKRKLNRLYKLEGNNKAYKTLLGDFQNDMNLNTENLDRYKGEFLSLYSKAVFDSLQIQWSSIDSSIDSLSEKKPTLVDYLVRFHQEQIEYNVDQYEDVINSLAALLREKSLSAILLPGAEADRSMEAKQFISRYNEEKLDRETSFNNAIIKSNAGFSMPSQAEMIDALAVYLSKRVKQEVAIAFIEKLNNYINDEKILTSLFPATLHLLNNRDAYTRPNFGTSWQVALSEDFVKIPENIPLCLPNRYQRYSGYLHDGIQIGKLVQQKYSFVDAINRIQEDSILKVSALKQANSILFMINHEFYNKNNPGVYWISADQLRNVKQEQLEWIYILLDIRYGDILSKQIHEKWTNKQIWTQAYFTKKVYPFRNWMTKVISQLNQFENEIQTSRNNVTPSKTSTALMGYWKFQNDLMDVLIDTNFIRIPPESMKWLGLTKGVFSLYNAIDSKNYSLIVDQMLKLFAMLELDKQVDLQDVLFKPQFNKALKRKGPEVKQEINHLLTRLNDNYDKLSNEQYMVSILSNYQLITKELKDKGNTEILNGKQNLETVRNTISELLQSKKDFRIDSILFKPEFLAEIRNSSRYNYLKDRLATMDEDLQFLSYFHQDAEEGIVLFDSLKVLLRQYKLNKPSYYKIGKAHAGHFVKDKIFTLNASHYNIFLNHVESRSQYKKILTTLSFLSDVMQSDNSNDLSKVIEAYALPPSSYKLKRHSRFSVNIDAMVGAFGGVEFIKNENNEVKPQAVGGLSAPIGLSVSWGKRAKVKKSNENPLTSGEFGFVNHRGKYRMLKGYNLTILASVIDIGAVVSYRISGGQDGGLPEDAKWSQFFSPGLTAQVGIKGVPLSIGGGVRFTPNLRNLNNGLTSNAVRFDLGLYFDLPLVNIFYH